MHECFGLLLLADIRIFFDLADHLFTVFCRFNYCLLMIRSFHYQSVFSGITSCLSGTATRFSVQKVIQYFPVSNMDCRISELFFEFDISIIRETFQQQQVSALKIWENINQFSNLTYHLAVDLNFIFKHIYEVTPVHPGYQFTKA